MHSTRIAPRTTIPVVLAAILSGCSQFPSLVQRSRPSESTGARSGDQERQIVRFGEDPIPGDAPVDPVRRRSNLLLTKARLSLADGDAETAVRTLESILAEDPQHGEASRLLAVLQTRSGELEAADVHFRAALAHDGDNAQVLSDYGYFCYLVGRWEDAERFLTRATEIDPELAEAQTNLGMLEARLGKMDSASQRFQYAGCTEVEVLNNLALARLLEEDFSVAEAKYRDALQRDPKNRAAIDGLRMARHLATAADDRNPATVSLSAGTATRGD